MALKVNDICNVMEEYAPVNLKETYDNVGLMIGDRNHEITSILVALDCTLEVIEEAIEKGCNLILTHHPILFFKPSTITYDTLQGRKIITLIKNGINVYSAHTNLDSTKNGLNDLLMQLLQLENSSTLGTVQGNTLENGIGRISTLKEPVELLDLVYNVKENLNIENIRYVGDQDKLIKKVAVINGSGQDFFNVAMKAGADCIITGDTSYHYVSDFKEEGIAIIDAGHFDTEWPVMKLVSQWLKNKLLYLSFENQVILSQKTKNPYKTI